MQSPPPLPHASPDRPRWLLPFLVIFAGAGLIGLGVIIKRTYLQTAAGLQGVRAQTGVTIVQANLLQIRALAGIYFHQFPQRTEVSWKEAKALNPSFSDLKSVAGENYDEVIVRKGQPKVSLVLPDGRVVEINK